MLVAGDFNSIPGSPAHSLLVKGKVEPAQIVSDVSRDLREARQLGYREMCQHVLDTIMSPQGT
jgi:hypothetical protein